MKVLKTLFSDEEEDLQESNENGIAVALTVLAWIILLSSIIAAFVIEEEFTIILLVVCGIISFIITLAFAEVIQILHDIRAKIK